MTPKPGPRPRPRPDAGTSAPVREPEVEAVEEAPAAEAVTAEAVTTEQEQPTAEVLTEEEPESREAEPETTAEEIAEPGGVDRPSPRRKTRDTGIAKPTRLSKAEQAQLHRSATPATATEPAAKPETGPVNRTLVLTGALVLAALLLAGLAVFFKIKGNEVSAATGNTALLDVARTAQVKQEATAAAETLFSYNYQDIAKTENAAKDLLVNDQVRGKYDNLMGQVRKLAPEQKIVVTVKASRSAVVTLDGDRARVMVFVDQTSTRTDKNQTSTGGAQLWFNVEQRDGKWKVDDMDTYNVGAAPGAVPVPQSQSPAPSK